MLWIVCQLLTMKVFSWLWTSVYWKIRTCFKCLSPWVIAWLRQVL
jgi:hypothetical protein